MTRKELEKVMEYLNKGDEISGILIGEIAENGKKYIANNQDAFGWIDGVGDAIMFREELEKAIEENLDDEDGEEETTMVLRQVEDISELKILNNFQVEYMIENTDQENRRGISIIFKKEKEDSVTMYRQLLFGGDGKQYISDEF